METIFKTSTLRYEPPKSKMGEYIVTDDGIYMYVNTDGTCRRIISRSVIEEAFDKWAICKPVCNDSSSKSYKDAIEDCLKELSRCVNIHNNDYEKVYFEICEWLNKNKEGR